MADDAGGDGGIYFATLPPGGELFLSYTLSTRDVLMDEEFLKNFRKFLFENTCSRTVQSYKCCSKQ